MAKEKEEKKSGVQAALDMINKQQGAGSIYVIKDHKPVPLDRLDSGSIGINYITGGGYPIGKVTELDGWESSGKTTVCLLAVRNAQKRFPDRVAVYIDSEHALDLNYARKLGVDTDKMILSQPDHIENGFQAIETLVKTGEVSIVVFDSVAGAITEKQFNGEIGDSEMGVKAKLMSQAMPKFAAMLNQNRTTGMFINQFREKIGVMFGSPITTPGGNALKFTASIRIEVRQSGKVKDKEENFTGIQVSAKCIKNKTAMPYLETKYHIEFGEGIDRLQEIIDFSEEMEIIKKSGSWYSYGETKLGQGSNGVKSTLTDNPELADELERLIYKGLDEQ